MENNNTLIAIGEKIRIARKAKGMNQKQLGDAIGKSIRAVQMYEKGETDLNITLLESLSSVLDINLADLVGKSKSENLVALSDVIEFLINLSKVKNLHFEVDVKKPPMDEEWECSIVFKGKDPAENNTDMCLALETFKNELGTAHEDAVMQINKENRLIDYYKRFNLITSKK
ncbi:MAG: helix-turn-helix transcriptional regulator [Lachnospiraceae bacterium]|nr:helix-turn-helix transcriptional regulator [Lachnospiraceae bacterium]